MKSQMRKTRQLKQVREKRYEKCYWKINIETVFPKNRRKRMKNETKRKPVSVDKKWCVSSLITEK